MTASIKGQKKMIIIIIQEEWKSFSLEYFLTKYCIVCTSLFSSTADIRFKYKPIVTSVNEVPVDFAHKLHNYARFCHNNETRTKRKYRKIEEMKRIRVINPFAFSPPLLIKRAGTQINQIIRCAVAVMKRVY